MTDISEIVRLVETQGADLKTWREAQEAKFNELQKDFDQYVLASQRPGVSFTQKSDDGVDRRLLDQGLRAWVAGNQVKANELFIQAKAMATDSDPDGGYLVGTDFSSTMTSVMAEVSPLYRMARKIPVMGDSFEEPLDRDQAEAKWVGEAEARGDTDNPQLGMFRCELNEIYAQPKITQKLVDTARIDMIAWMRDKIADAFAVKESDAFHIGDGVGKPRGLLTYPTAATSDATRAWGTFEHINTGASGAFHTNKADPLIDLVASLKPQYRSGAVWLMNRTVAATIRKIKESGSDRYLWSDSLTMGQPSTLLGYPVELDDSMPDPGAGSLSIAFGNVARTYTVIEKPGVKLLNDPYTAKPFVRLFAYRRVGGGVNHFESMKFLRFAAS